MTTMNPAKTVTLEEAISTQINLGVRDPLDVARAVEKLHGEVWMREEVAKYAEDVVRDMARRMLGSVRRGFETALRPGDNMSQALIKTTGFWIPGENGYPEWKSAADVTPDDFDSRAAFLERLARGSLKGAWWCREAARLMRDQGAATLRDFGGELPALPDESVDLLQLVA